MLKIHIIFRPGFSLSSYPKAYLKMKVELNSGVTPRHISKRVELNSGRRHNFDSELGFRKTFHFHVPPVETLKIHFIFGSRVCLRRWKMLKIHIIFDPGSYPKAYLKMLGRTQFSQKYNL
ncbi:hypothetical protein E2320_000123 [Naja naja]|nr:hypothetical protein E2320_000123 [Naja naja]